MPVRRWQRWRVVDPLRDGRECPDCLAAIYGRASRKAHREYHIRRTEWDTAVINALAEVARRGGLRVAFGELPEGRYDPEEDDDGAEQYG